MQKQKILLLEAIHPVAKELLEKEGFIVRLEKKAFSEEELLKELAGIDALGIRSKTNVTEKVLKANPQLKVVGAFCIGTNQIDLKSAKDLGITVFNAPHSNTRSVAELVLGEIIMLSRKVMDKSRQAHQGGWDKAATGCFEVRGKTLGIVGYGNIGGQVSVLAEALGMKVIFFDIQKKLAIGNAKAKMSLLDVLIEANFVSLHVPDTKLTQNMIQLDQLKMMKKGSYLINASRGGVVDIKALSESLKSGHLAGAAIDVFPYEPASNTEVFKTELQNLENVILTPHIGGSTEEAQEAIGVEVAKSFIAFLKNGRKDGEILIDNQ